jgi:hypothetical protein
MDKILNNDNRKKTSESSPLFIFMFLFFEHFQKSYEQIYNMITLILIVLLSLLYLYKTSDIFYFDIVG